MKQCPHCRSVVDDETACKICGTTLTYEPPVDAPREKYAPRKETRLYYLKRYLPFLLSACITVPLLLLSKADPLRHISLLILILAAAVTVFERRVAQGMRWKHHYNPEYAVFRARLAVYTLSALAVLTAVLSYTVY